MKPDPALLDRLHPDIAERVIALADAAATAHLLSPADVRGAFLRQRRPLQRPDVPLDIQDLSIDTGDGPLALRLYRPQRQQPVAMLYMHGGGFTVGDLDSHDATCCLLALEAGVLVVSVDYRVLPDHPFPAALNDTTAALRWLAGARAQLGADPDRLAIGGDSSGANLALAAALVCRDDITLDAMWLAYPIIGADFDTPSYQANANAPLLTRIRCQRILRDYLGRDLGPDDWRVAPLLATQWAGLPAAVLLVGDLDPLFSDSEQLHDRLIAAGVPSTLIRAQGMPHGFLRWVGDSSVCKALGQRSAAALAACLGTQA